MFLLLSDFTSATCLSFIMKSGAANLESSSVINRSATVLSFSLPIIISAAITLWTVTPATNENVLFMFSLSLFIQSVFAVMQKIDDFRVKRCSSHQKKQNSGAEFHKRVDLNLSRAENALNLIRYVLAADLPEDLRQCLKYCEEVLLSSYDEMHVPQALLQLPVLIRRTNDDLLRTAGGDEAVLQWLRAQYTRTKSATTLAQALAARFDCVTIADLGCTVQDWLVTEFSHCAAPLPHSPEEPTTTPAVPEPRSELAGAEDSNMEADGGSPTAEALRRAAGRRWRRSSFCDSRRCPPPLIGFVPVADDDGRSDSAGFADEPAVKTPGHPAAEGTGRADKAAAADAATGPAAGDGGLTCPPLQGSPLPLRLAAAAAEAEAAKAPGAAAKPAKSFGPGVRDAYVRTCTRCVCAA